MLWKCSLVEVTFSESHKHHESDNGCSAQTLMWSTKGIIQRAGMIF